MSTVSEKLTYLNGTKTALKDVINLTDAGITSETTFRNYATKLYDGYVEILKDRNILLDNMPKQTVTGTTLSIANAADLPVYEFEMTKESTQETTTGKNLFSGLIKGIGINAANGTETTDNKRASSNYIYLDINNVNEFVISGLPDTLYNFVAAYNSNKQFLGRTDGSATITRVLRSDEFTYGTPQGTGDIKYIRVSVYENVNIPGTIDDIDNAQIQLEEGSTATSYEPYTNGASPNPDYPQEVKTVKGSVDVKVIGKNLWSLENQYSFTSREATWYFINGIRGAYGSNIGNKTQKKFFCKSGKTYIFQMTFDASVSSSSMVWSNESSNGITRISSTSSSGKVEFKIIGKDDYVIPRIYMYANSSISITNVMIEDVSSSVTSASEYETYQESNVPLPLNGNEIAGKGTNLDKYIVDKNGKCYLNKVFNQIDSYNGETITTDYWSTTGGLDTGATVYYVRDNPDLIDLNTTVDLRLFKGVNNITNSEDGNMRIRYVESIDTIINEIEDIKTRLSVLEEE